MGYVRPEMSLKESVVFALMMKEGEKIQGRKIAINKGTKE